MREVILQRLEIPREIILRQLIKHPALQQIGKQMQMNLYSLLLNQAQQFTQARFFSINDSARNKIAAIDSATGNATTWNPSIDLYVQAIAVSGICVYVGGGFSE